MRSNVGLVKSGLVLSLLFIIFGISTPNLSAAYLGDGEGPPIGSGSNPGSIIDTATQAAELLKSEGPAYDCKNAPFTSRREEEKQLAENKDCWAIRKAFGTGADVNPELLQFLSEQLQKIIDQVMSGGGTGGGDLSGEDYDLGDIGDGFDYDLGDIENGFDYDFGDDLDINDILGDYDDDLGGYFGDPDNYVGGVNPGTDDGYNPFNDYYGDPSYYTDPDDDTNGDYNDPGSDYGESPSVYYGNNNTSNSGDGDRDGDEQNNSGNQGDGDGDDGGNQSGSGSENNNNVWRFESVPDDVLAKYDLKTQTYDGQSVIFLDADGLDRIIFDDDAFIPPGLPDSTRAGYLNNYPGYVYQKDGQNIFVPVPGGDNPDFDWEDFDWEDVPGESFWSTFFSVLFSPFGFLISIF